MACIEFRRVVVETCVDCWAAELTFRGPPGAEEVVEYIDILFMPAMVSWCLGVSPRPALMGMLISQVTTGLETTLLPHEPFPQ